MLVSGIRIHAMISGLIFFNALKSTTVCFPSFPSVPLVWSSSSVSLTYVRRSSYSCTPSCKVNTKTGTYAKAECHQADCHDHDFFNVSHTNLRLFFLEKGLPVNRALNVCSFPVPASFLLPVPHPPVKSATQSTAESILHRFFINPLHFLYLKISFIIGYKMIQYPLYTKSPGKGRKIS